MTDAEHDYEIAMVLYLYWQKDQAYRAIADQLNMNHNEVSAIVKQYPPQEYDPRAVPPEAPRTERER